MNQPHKFAIAWTISRSLADDGGGSFYNSKYRICVKGGSDSLVVWDPSHFHGTSLQDYPPSLNSASRSGPVPVLSLSGLKPWTGPVPESFRNQGPWTTTAKNRKKPVQTGRNRFCNKYIKMRHIPAKSGLGI